MTDAEEMRRAFLQPAENRSPREKCSEAQEIKLQLRWCEHYYETRLGVGRKILLPSAESAPPWEQTIPIGPIPKSALASTRAQMVRNFGMPDTIPTRPKFQSPHMQSQARSTSTSAACHDKKLVPLALSSGIRSHVAADTKSILFINLW